MVDKSVLGVVDISCLAFTGGNDVVRLSLLRKSVLDSVRPGALIKLVGLTRNRTCCVLQGAATLL